ncbi:lysine biosynthesis protein LysW [Streptomyces sp. NPDC059009]|uniref:lysine biosynthesis protein LysW n=1 Tax=Streptomyces sp. NPDC059009 TaxID=3346694 RepID=UPI0036A72F59
MSTVATLCPECETELSLPPLTEGETVNCPECLLTLRVTHLEQGRVELELVEAELRDWGQ